MSQARVLLVDDDPNILRAMERLLRKLPVETLVEVDSRRALERVEREHVDILVCDYVMPHMNGVEVLVAARERFPSLVRVLVTGAGDVDVKARAAKVAGIEHFLEKPWETGELQRVIGELAERLAKQRHAIQ